MIETRQVPMTIVRWDITLRSAGRVQAALRPLTSLRPLVLAVKSWCVVGAGSGYFSIFVRATRQAPHPADAQFRAMRRAVRCQRCFPVAIPDSIRVVIARAV